MPGMIFECLLLLGNALRRGGGGGGGGGDGMVRKVLFISNPTTVYGLCCVVLSLKL